MKGKNKYLFECFVIPATPKGQFHEAGPQVRLKMGPCSRSCTFCVRRDDKGVLFTVIFFLFFFLIQPLHAQTPADLGPIEPDVHTVDSVATSPDTKPAVDLPYKPKEDSPEQEITVEAHQSSGKSKKVLGDPLESYDLPYVMSKAPETVGAADPSL